MPSVGYEPATPETKQPQTYALERVSTRIGQQRIYTNINTGQCFQCGSWHRYLQGIPKQVQELSTLYNKYHILPLYKLHDPIWCAW
jgi:hypothetical protein